MSSQGDVLADRSVQYKYLNPNLVGVVTESADPSQPLVSVYLVDSVSGAIVYHTSHKNAVGPVHMAHSENWIVVHTLCILCLKHFPKNFYIDHSVAF